MDPRPDRSPEESDELDRLLEEALPAPFGPEAVRTSAAGTDSDFFAPGQIVEGFELVSQLGKGGMGHVWEARQMSLGGRRVALKFVRPEFLTDRTLQYFDREARAGGRLSHPGLVAVHGHGRAQGLAWIAMELVPGGRTLQHRLEELRATRELPANHDRGVATLVAGLADAMQAAHDQGVVHRDLKPKNILEGPDGHLKVSDYGLARIQDESALTQQGEIAGTYPYMSPEQLAGTGREKVDHRTDVFSLGIVMYELLTLERPFQGDTQSETAEKIKLAMPRNPRALRSSIPRDLSVLCLKALEKQPRDRFASMADLASELRRFLRNEPILTRPPGPIGRARRWIARHPALTGTSLVVLLSGTVAIRASRVTYAMEKQARYRAFPERLDDLRRRYTHVTREEASQNLESEYEEVDSEVPPSSGPLASLSTTSSSFYGRSLFLGGGEPLVPEDAVGEVVLLLGSVGWGITQRSNDQWLDELRSRGPVLDAYLFLMQAFIDLGALGEPGGTTARWQVVLSEQPRAAAWLDRSLEIMSLAPPTTRLAFNAARSAPAPGERLTLTAKELRPLGAEELSWLADRQSRAGNADEAARLIDRALLASPGRQHSHRTRAWTAYRAGEFEILLADATACNSLNEAAAWTWRLLGRAHLEFHRSGAGREAHRERSQRAYERAIKIEPTHGDAYAELVQVIEDRDERVRILEEGRRLADPPSLFVYLNLLHYHARLEDPESVIAEAIEAFPDEARTLHNAGVYYWGQKDYPRMVEVLEQAVAANERYWQVWKNLSMAYGGLLEGMSEDDPEASAAVARMIEAARRAHDLRPTDVGLLGNYVGARFVGLLFAPSPEGAHAYFEEHLPDMAEHVDDPEMNNRLRQFQEALPLTGLDAGDVEAYRAEIDAILEAASEH